MRKLGLLFTRMDDGLLSWFCSDRWHPEVVRLSRSNEYPFRSPKSPTSVCPIERNTSAEYCPAVSVQTLRQTFLQTFREFRPRHFAWYHIPIGQKSEREIARTTFIRLIFYFKFIPKFCSLTFYAIFPIESVAIIRLHISVGVLNILLPEQLTFMRVRVDTDAVIERRTLKRNTNNACNNNEAFGVWLIDLTDWLIVCLIILIDGLIDWLFTCIGGTAFDEKPFCSSSSHAFLHAFSDKGALLATAWLFSRTRGQRT